MFKVNTNSETKKNILSVIDYALKETSIGNLMNEKIKLSEEVLEICGKRYNTKNYQKIHVFGSGKASYDMAFSIEKILKGKIESGLVIHNKKSGKIGKINVKCGTHPFPSQRNIKATEELIKMAEKTGKNDLSIFLLSGGSSSLLCKPDMGLEEYVKEVKKIMKSGKGIRELNDWRKKHSLVKGGELAKHFKGETVCLVISDVVGNPIGYIGSGPLDKKGIEHFFIADNNTLTQKAKEKAKKMGYRTNFILKDFEGSPEKLAEKIIPMTEKMKKGDCLVSGGELSSKVVGKGKGGPNQEFVLLCREAEATIASLDSDGNDGNSPAAGGIACNDDFTEEEVEKALEKSDSFSLFRNKRLAIITGHTGNNLNDLRIIVKG